MASAYVEYGVVALPAPTGFSSGAGSSVYGKCAATEVLTLSASQVVGTVTGGAGKNSVRVTVDAAAFVAKGSTPDASATTATSATDAKRYLAAGTSIDLILYAGQKIAVLAAS